MRALALVTATAATLVVGIALVGAIIWVSHEVRPERNQTSQTVLKRGNYNQYTYAIERSGGENKKVAQFEPSLPADDTVVIPALKAVAYDALGETISEDVQPVVQARDETNFITLRTSSGLVWFELFRNSTGKVGSARIWLER